MTESVRLSAGYLRDLIPWPGRDADKYSRGKLVLLAGSADYPGAACLAARASQRAGAGYTEAFCAPESVPILQGRCPSAVARPWGLFDGAALGERSHGHPWAVVVGPGLVGDDPDQAALVLRALEQVRAPMLVDGGALAILATAEGRAAARRRAEAGHALVLTPHRGEAARLASGARLAPLEGAALACALADAYGAVVALKGPQTHIAAPGKPAALMGFGTAALAKAGTGDVLAGIVGALLAQGLEPFDAAALGSSLHAEAGRAAAERLGEVSVIAEDVAEAIPEAVRRLS